MFLLRPLILKLPTSPRLCVHVSVCDRGVGWEAVHTHPKKSLCEGLGKESPLSPTVSLVNMALFPLVCSTPVLRRREARGEVSEPSPAPSEGIEPSTFFFELCLHCPVVLAYTSKYQEGLERNKGAGGGAYTLVYSAL